MKTKPRVLIFSGFGLNCEDETRFAFMHAGAEADIVHINDLIEKPSLLRRYDIAALPGGFSYGDDLGSGKAYARRLMHHVGEEIERFLSRDTLMLGVCNGFQILTTAGLLPGALITNDSARFVCRWVDLEVEGASPWFAGMKTLSLPIAHGEGKYIDSEKNLQLLEKNHAVALRYRSGPIARLQHLDANPNGSLGNIAGVTAREGRVLGLMPHPERATYFTQLPLWTLMREEYIRAGKPLPKYAEGIQLFHNAVKYFS